MSKVIFIFFTFCLLSCSSMSIYSEAEFIKMNKTTLYKPQRFVGKELDLLINGLKETDYDIKFNTIRNFILESISIKLNNNYTVKIYFDRNTTFDFGGGLMNKNKWDIEKLKLEKVGAIKIYYENEMISHHCKYKYCDL